MTKFCPKCNEDKLFTEFHKKSKSRDGLQYICISCRKEMNADYYKATPEKDEARHNSRQIRKQLVASRIEPLLSAGCTDCHECFPPESMDFDHVRGEKITDISSLGSSSYPVHEMLNLLEEELSKCEAVCANCHRIRTINRHQNSARRDYFKGIMDSKLLSAKKLYVYEFVSTHGCMDCDECDMRVLELDHVSGEKVADLAYMITGTRTYSLEDVQNEIAKCEVVCVNCHRVRTRNKRKSLSAKRGIVRREKLCACGNKKPGVYSVVCRECSDRVKSDLYSHLTTEEMVANVQLMGMKPYATTLGLSDNGLKKVLIRRGVQMPLRKKK